MPHKPISLIRNIMQEFKLVSGENCKPKLIQLKEIFQLILRCQYTPDEYFSYQFYQKDISYSEMLNYLSKFYSLNYLHPLLNKPQWAHIMSNKFFFNSYYRYYEFPLTRIIGFFNHNGGFRADGSILASSEDLKRMILDYKPPGLVVKPVSGSSGRNILVIHEINYDGHEIEFIDSRGKSITFFDLVEHIYKVSKLKSQSGCILEERIKQHQFLDSFNRDSLNTVRVVTLLRKDYHADVYLAVLRLGRMGFGIDNVSQGGLVVGIDLKEGILGEGSLYTKFGSNRYSEHPDSGVKFKGSKIPFWEEIKNMCCKAALVTPFCRSVGWDVALTPTGPVLVEGNHYWALDLQVHSGGYLQPEVRKVLAEYDILFPERKLPPVNYKNLWKAVKLWSNKK